MLRNLLIGVTMTLTGLTAAASPQAKYVFLFIGDGMGMGHVNATEYYNRFTLGNDEPLLMMQFPVASQALTYSASSKVTDSAAAGTALASGYKTKNSMIGMTPDTTAVYSIAHRLKNEGRRIAILTSNAPDDATPAAFYAHTPSRRNYRDIDVDAVHSGFDFMGGCSLRGYDDQLKAMIDSAGIQIVYGTDGTTLSDNPRLWILSPDGVWGNRNNIGYANDSIPGAMKLADLTRAAINHVSKDAPEGFFMMVENGLSDHAAHANDPASVIREVLVLQDAIGEAYKFYLQHPDETLIVVTADHDTGGMAIGHPNHHGHVDLSQATRQSMSKDRFADICRDRVKDGHRYTWPEMQSMLKRYFGLWDTMPVTPEQEEQLKAAFDKTFVQHASENKKGLYNAYNEFITGVFDLINYNMGTDFITGNHTANPVPVYAIGVGAERFGRMLNNIEIPTIIYSITQVD